MNDKKKITNDKTKLTTKKTTKIDNPLIIITIY